jgi:hypothetical protein
LISEELAVYRGFGTVVAFLTVATWFLVESKTIKEETCRVSGVAKMLTGVISVSKLPGNRIPRN